MSDPAVQNLSSALASAASKCLNVPAGELAPRVPLSRYGLDSLATVELTAAIEQMLSRRLPESLLIEHPDLESLERYLSTVSDTDFSPVSSFEQMQRDSVLPAEIHPAANSQSHPAQEAVLLTGATGFLGAYLLRSLLLRTRASVYCLVRPADGQSAGERIKRAMQNYGIWDPDFESRITVVEGDLTSPLLGLSRKQYAALCSNVGAVYHSAAAVNWVYSYQALRSVNVLGTLELIRLACASRPKAFHFVSTLGVCCSTTGPHEVREDDDVHSYLRGIHLGYAQSKCVAESLVRQAGERGLPVNIFRPSLITGDRASGVSNSADLLSRLIKATVQMEEAPDLDWRLECCPVDYVADAIVNLANRSQKTGVFHLVSPARRHWRELVLWMNLFGYRVRLRPYREWLQRLEEEAAPGHPLRTLLPFFLRKPAGEGGLTLPELYEEPRRSRVRCESTLESLRAWPLDSPELDTRLLDRYFLDYIDRGFLPPVERAPCQSNGDAEIRFDSVLFTRIMRRFHEDDTIEVPAVRLLHGGSDYSIISELTSWKHGSAAGLKRYRLTVVGRGPEPETVDAVVKQKARDVHVIDVAEQIAGQCGPGLGRAFKLFGRDLGLAGCHVRELGVYQQQDERFRRHSPTLFAALRDDLRGQWTLVLEDISGLELLDSADDVSGWSGDCVEAVVLGLAELQSIWYGRERKLLDQPWLGPVIPASRRAGMHQLWTALAEFAAGRFGSENGSSMKTLQRRLVAGVGDRWRRMERMPRTLIHNDFNPRNVALRRESRARRLCAYDWELTTIGVPQHDLAEFLCFVLTPELHRTEVRHYLDLHRSALERASKRSIDAGIWELGFRLSLHDLPIDRFAMYAMVDRFRPQRFLGRVISTWRALYDLFPVEDTGQP